MAGLRGESRRTRLGRPSFKRGKGKAKRRRLEGREGREVREEVTGPKVTLRVVQSCRCSRAHETSAERAPHPQNNTDQPTQTPSSASAGHKCLSACTPCLCLELRSCLDLIRVAASTSHRPQGRLYLLFFRYNSSSTSLVRLGIHL